MELCLFGVYFGGLLLLCFLSSFGFVRINHSSIEIRTVYRLAWAVLPRRGFGSWECINPSTNQQLSNHRGGILLIAKINKQQMINVKICGEDLFGSWLAIGWTFCACLANGYALVLRTDNCNRDGIRRFLGFSWDSLFCVSPCFRVSQSAVCFHEWMLKNYDMRVTYSILRIIILLLFS